MNISDIKNILSRKFRGASLDDVQGISNYSVFGEAAKNLLAKIDPFETVRHGEVNLFQEVYDYGLSTAAPDLKGKKILDIRPQVNRVSTDNSRQTFTEDFDRDKEDHDLEFSVEFDEGTKFLRYTKSITGSVNVTETTDDNWTAGTGVSNIAEDTIILLDRSGRSLRFDVSSGTNLITWDGDSTIDLSTHTQKSSFFLPVYWPDSSIISSIKIRVGSSSANYYEITGSIHFGSARNGANLYRFDWNGVSDAGTTDEAAIDYVRLEITTTSADTDIRIGTLSSKLPHPSELVYYSNALFRPVSGSTWLSTPTADTNVLNLDPEAENLFIYECCVLIADDMEKPDLVQKFDVKLNGDNNELGLYSLYKSDKPSEGIRPQSRYYTLRRTGRTRL